MINIDLITHENALRVFNAAYARRVGRGQGRIGWADLERVTGIAQRTLKSWRFGDSMPQLENLLRLAVAFGPSFMSEILHPIGQGGVELVDPVESSASQCVAELTRPLHEIAERLRDGVFCHSDKAAVGPMLIEAAHVFEEQGWAMIDEARAGR